MSWAVFLAVAAEVGKEVVKDIAGGIVANAIGMPAGNPITLAQAGIQGGLGMFYDARIKLFQQLGISVNSQDYVKCLSNYSKSQESLYEEIGSMGRGLYANDDVLYNIVDSVNNYVSSGIEARTAYYEELGDTMIEESNGEYTQEQLDYIRENLTEQGVSEETQDMLIEMKNAQFTVSEDSDINEETAQAEAESEDNSISY